jgi:hypothetical protein
LVQEHRVHFGIFEVGAEVAHSPAAAGLVQLEVEPPRIEYEYTITCDITTLFGDPLYLFLW